MKQLFSSINLLSGRPWCLHNPLKGWTIKGLSDGEVKALLFSLSNAEKAVTVIWRKDWIEWERLLYNEKTAHLMEFEETDVDPPDLPENLLRNDDHEVTQVQVRRRSRGGINDRKFRRLEIRLPIEVVAANGTFKSHTVDISEGGIHIVDPLPDWVAGYFPVIISTETGPLEVNCMIVEDQFDEKKRIGIVSLEVEEEEPGLIKLKSWLNTKISEIERAQRKG